VRATSPEGLLPRDRLVLSAGCRRGLDEYFKPNIVVGIQLLKYRCFVLFEMSSCTQDICNTLVDTTQGLGKEKPFWSSSWSLGGTWSISR